MQFRFASRALTIDEGGKRHKSLSTDSSWLLTTEFSDECRSYRERAIDDRKWECRQPAGGRSEHDLRTFPGIKFGVVARTFQDILLAYVRFDPLRDGTSGVCANQRIGDNAVGRSRSRGVVEFARVKPYEDNFVEPRALADHRGFWILRPSVQGRPVELEITGFDDFAFVFAIRVHE